jgi:DNA-binding response OmpR family regulator
MRAIVMDLNRKGSRSVQALRMAAFAVRDEMPHVAVLDVSIRKRRQRFRVAAGAGEVIIRTRWGRGYFLPRSPRVA